MRRQLSTFVSSPRYDIPASQERGYEGRTARCDGVLLTAHDVLIIATDDDDDAGTAKWILRSSNDESARTRRASGEYTRKTVNSLRWSGIC